MIKILEGPTREVEKLANQMEPEGWMPIGPAIPNGHNAVTNAKVVMLTMVKPAKPQPGKDIPTDKDWNRFAYELNSAGCCDE